MTLPDIVVTRRDLGRLDSLLGNAVLARVGKVGAFLLDEITRARIIDDDEFPLTLVTMGATIQFRDEELRRVSVVRLVYPREVDLYRQGVSVLAPVGAALLGLSEGQSITYETLDGRLKTLTVLKVVGPAPGRPVPQVGDKAGDPGRLAEATRP